VPRRAKFYIAAVVVLGAASLPGSLLGRFSPQLSVWVPYLVLAIVASLVKLRLPGLIGTYSLSSLVFLFGFGRFTLTEILAVAWAGSLVQSVCNAKERPTIVQVLFNMANLTLSISVCFLVLRVLSTSGLDTYRPAVMALVACAYFVINTVVVSGILSLLNGKPLAQVCQAWYVWSLPYYLVGAAVVGLIPLPGQSLRAEGWLVVLPLGYLIHFFCELQGFRPSVRVNPGTTSESLPRQAMLYVLGVLAAGLILLFWATLQWQSQDPLRFACYLGLAVAAATLKVRLPGMRGTISMSFVLLLVAIAALSLTEAVLMATLVGIIQCVWKPKKPPTTIRTLFNGACLSLSTAIAYVVCNWATRAWLSESVVGLVILATLVLYTCNTFMVAAVLCLVERRALFHVWQNCYFWSFPYYLVGSALAGLMTATCRSAGWQASLLVLPMAGLVYVTYRVHVSHCESACWGS
jgi:hypothetical protein